jgi:hypothetical protein
MAWTLYAPLSLCGRLLPTVNGGAVCGVYPVHFSVDDGADLAPGVDARSVPVIL